MVYACIGVVAALVIGRGNHFAAPFGDPRRPVLPPGGVHQVCVRFPFMRVGGKTVVYPVLGLGIGRIDDTGYVAG